MILILREYVIWQWVFAPRWLAGFLADIGVLLWRYFSVPHVVRTLVAPWRKDVALYSDRSFTGLVHTWAMNLVARVIGMFVRSVALFLWLVITTAYVPLAVLLWILFICWPFLLLLCAVIGVAWLYV